MSAGPAVVGRPVLLAAVVLSTSLGLVGGAAAAWGIYQRLGPVQRIASVPQQPGEDRTSGAQGVSAVVTAAEPAVVQVVTRPITAGDLQGGVPSGAFATGFVVTADGLVVTSAHAVEGATRLALAFPDGRVVDAGVAGKDVTHGLVVLRAAGLSGLPALGFTTSSPRPGDAAVAVGEPPFGGPSVTSGTVRSTAGELAVPGPGGTTTILGTISVDAPPAPGDDGAPLLDAGGRVMGVVVSAASAPDMVALDGRAAAALVDAIDGSGGAARGSIGAAAVALAPGTAAAAGLPQGALVRSVDPGGAADQAGIVPGDVITAVDGAPVDQAHPLDATIAGLAPGSRVAMSVVHAGRTATVAVTVSAAS